MIVKKWRSLENWQKAVLLSLALPPLAVSVLYLMLYLLIALEKGNLPKFLEVIIHFVATIFSVDALANSPGYAALFALILVLLPSLIFTIRAYEAKERFAWITLIGFLVLLIELVWLISIVVKVSG